MTNISEAIAATKRQASNPLEGLRVVLGIKILTQTQI